MASQTIKLIEKKNLWFFISSVIIISGLVLMGMRSVKQEPVLNFGIDFTGGASFILSFDTLDQAHRQSNLDPETINLNFIQSLRASLKDMDLDNSQLQITEDLEVLIKTPHLSNDRRKRVLEALEVVGGSLTVLEIDIIGPTIGEELRRQSIWIILVVSLGLLLYIWWRFELIYGAAALLAVLHDALILISLAAFLTIEVNTAFVAAILTVLGYSINDTIVIFDRIRENSHIKDSGPVKALLNRSISQMFTRSIHTSFTTVFVVLSLFIFGGTTIKSFALVLMMGILAGTYSSLFIASPFLYVFSGETNSLSQGEPA